MELKKRIALIVTAICFLAVLAGANQLGPRGLILIPTTDVSRQGVTGLGFGYTENKFNVSFKVTLIDNVELGIGGSNYGPLYGFFKWRLIGETPSSPSFSVGATGSEFYGVISKNLTDAGLKGHIGLSTGGYGIVFGGVSYIINPIAVSSGKTPIPVITLMGEFLGLRQDGVKKNVINIGSRLQFNRDFGVDVSVLNFNSLSIGAYLTTTF